MTWTTLVGVGTLVALHDRVLLVRQRRPYGVHWERESDRRRNVLAFFRGEAEERPAPRPQAEEGIEAAGFVDPATLSDLHPLDRPVLQRWAAGETGFHLHAEVSVRPDGTQGYRFRA
jgi:hypothetical protein